MLDRKKNKFLFFVIVSLYISFGLLASVIGVIIERFQIDYNARLTIAALLPFVFFLAYGFTSIPFVMEMDKYVAKAILVLGTVLVTIGSLLCYIGNNYIIIILAIFLVGVGVTAIQVAGNPFIRELDAPSKYIANFTIIIGVGSLGYAFSSLLVPIMQSNGFSWKTVYLLFAIINAILLVFLLLSRFPAIKLIGEEKINTFKISILLKDPIILTYSLGLFLYIGAEVGTSSYIITYMNKIHGVSNAQSFWNRDSFMYNVFPSKTALIVVLFWFSQSYGRLIISRMMKYIREKKILIFHSLGTVIVLIVGIYKKKELTALVMFALEGYFTCASFTFIFSAAINRFKKNHRASSGMLGAAIIGGAFTVG